MKSDIHGVYVKEPTSVYTFCNLFLLLDIYLWFLYFVLLDMLEPYTPDIILCTFRCIYKFYFFICFEFVDLILDLSYRSFLLRH